MLTSYTAARPRYVIHRDGCGVRSRPCESGDVVLPIPHGTRLTVLGAAGDWLQVTRRSPSRVRKLPPGRRALGWVPRSAVATAPPLSLALTCAINAEAGLDVWREPSPRSDPVGILPHGASVTVTGFAGRWARLSAPLRGWAPRAFFDLELPAAGS